MYERIVWQDQIAERARTYSVIENADGTKTLIPEPGEVTQEGTALNAGNLNRSEAYLQNMAEAFNMLYCSMQAKIRSLEDRIETLETQIAALS